MTAAPYVGNTPTDVGKTRCRLLWLYASWKHPPRTWGRRHHGPCVVERLRNTPTNVGKTVPGQYVYAYCQKHPHERGEDLIEMLHVKPHIETPPRTWGRRVPQMSFRNRQRNTPTDVGKTISWFCLLCYLQKHPHRRGEDMFFKWRIWENKETPPQTWGRHS